MPESDAKAEEITPSVQFERFCKPMLDGHADAMRSLAEELKEVTSQQTDRALKDQAHDSTLDRLAGTVKKMNSQFDKVFTDSNGNSLVSQVRDSARCIHAVQISLSAHCAEHDDKNRSWKGLGMKVLTTLIVATIMGVAGLAMVGMQHNLTKSTQAEVRKAVDELKKGQQPVRMPASSGAVNANP